jgi:hypothetical protein
MYLVDQVCLADGAVEADETTRRLAAFKAKVERSDVHQPVHHGGQPTRQAAATW